MFCLFIAATPLTPNDSGRLHVCLQPVSADWNNLAKQLQMAEEVSDILKTQRLTNSSEHLGELLDRWLNTDHPTFQMLNRALQQLMIVTTRKATVRQAVTNLREFQKERGM